MTLSSSVYLVWYVPKHDEDQPLLIGVYDSDLQAQQAIERLRFKQGFANFQEGLEVSQYAVNQDHWTEGFIVDSNLMIVGETANAQKPQGPKGI